MTSTASWCNKGLTAAQRKIQQHNISYSIGMLDPLMSSLRRGDSMAYPINPEAPGEPKHKLTMFRTVLDEELGEW